MGSERGNDQLIAEAWMLRNGNLFRKLYDNGFELEYSAPDEAYEIYPYKPGGKLEEHWVVSIDNVLAEAYRREGALLRARTAYKTVQSGHLGIETLSKNVEYIKSIMNDFDISEEEIAEGGY